MRRSTVYFGSGGNIHASVPPKDEYMFYVMPPLEDNQQACLSNRLRELGPSDMFQLVDYSGVVTGVKVVPQESQQPLPLPSDVLSAIGACAGVVTFVQLPRTA